MLYCLVIHIFVCTFLCECSFEDVGAICEKINLEHNRLFVFIWRSDGFVLEIGNYTQALAGSVDNLISRHLNFGLGVYGNRICGRWTMRSFELFL